jgi:hypothetical protein
LRQSWSDFNKLCGPKLLFMRRRAQANPPDPNGRPNGMEKKGQRLLALLIEHEKVLRKPPNLLDQLLRRRKPSGARLRFLLLTALHAAAMIAAEIKY